MKRYNTPHRSRVIKTRLTEEEYAEFSERVSLCQMSQSEFIRQALTKSRIRPVIPVSPVNDTLLATVGKLTAEYGKIGGNLNQIARCLNISQNDTARKRARRHIPAQCLCTIEKQSNKRRQPAIP